MRSFDSSVGRAEDCRSVVEILRSLVRIRLEGIVFFLNVTDSSERHHFLSILLPFEMKTIIESVNSTSVLSKVHTFLRTKFQELFQKLDWFFQDSKIHIDFRALTLSPLSGCLFSLLSEIHFLCS